jgi:hypothetical protein
MKKFREFEEAMNFINQYRQQSLHLGKVAMAPSPASNTRATSKSKEGDDGYLAHPWCYQDQIPQSRKKTKLAW